MTQRLGGAWKTECLNGVSPCVLYLLCCTRDTGEGKKLYYFMKKNNIKITFVLHPFVYLEIQRNKKSFSGNPMEPVAHIYHLKSLN